MRKLLNTIYVTNEQMYLMLDGEYLSSVSDIGKCHGQAEYEVLVFQSSGT